MNKEITKFFKGRLKEELPVLLAFSGGPDSLALLHLLIEYGQKRPLKLAIAHVDHGWREESRAEAEEVALMAEKLGLPVHMKTLDPNELKGNLEAACREQRYQFFSSLCNEHGYQAVLLAHHADDVAETVLKRTFEGVILPYLSAMRSDAVIEGVKVWRPLLSVSKVKILDWLQKRGLKGFFDKTNLDTKFLRARLRVEVLPHLSRMFGKEISPGLCQISEDAGELRDYLDERIRPYLARIVRGATGGVLDLSETCPETLFELKYLIRQFCRQDSFSLSRECVTKAAGFVMDNSAKKSFPAGSGSSFRVFCVDRKRLFIK